MVINYPFICQTLILKRLTATFPKRTLRSAFSVSTLSIPWIRKILISAGCKRNVFNLWNDILHRKWRNTTYRFSWKTEKHYCSPIIRPLHFLHHFTTSPYWWAIQGEGGIPVSYTSCLRRLNRLHKCTKHPNCFPQEQYQESFHLVLPINKGIQPEGEEGERGKSNWKTSYLGI